MKIYKDIEQRSEEWFRIRAGRLTASNFSRLLTPTGRKSSQREGLIIELCCACIRPDEVQWEGNFHTDRGEALEDEAAEAFSNETGLWLEQVGFIAMDNNVVGCSPDRLILIDGKHQAGLEIKCPLSKNHAKWMLEGKLPEEHRAQVHGSMVVTGFRTWYFVSYCPGFPLFIVKVEWDEYTDKLKVSVEEFVIEYADSRKKIMPILTKKGVVAA